MALPVKTVKQFLKTMYSLISASSPTTPLHGSDQSDALEIMNALISSWSANGLDLTIARRKSVNIIIGQQTVTFADPSYTPVADVPEGRLANLQNAWVTLEGVTYPVYNESRNTFMASYKYEPLKGLPRFGIVYNDTNLTTLQIYPAPSQAFELSVYGKFEAAILDINDDLSGWPLYFILFMYYAVARDVCMFKGRSNAWTGKLESRYQELKFDMESQSPINLNIESDEADLLNGSWRVRAGI